MIFDWEMLSMKNEVCCPAPVNQFAPGYSNSYVHCDVFSEIGPFMLLINYVFQSQ